MKYNCGCGYGTNDRTAYIEHLRSHVARMPVALLVMLLLLVMLPSPALAQEIAPGRLNVYAFDDRNSDGQPSAFEDGLPGYVFYAVFEYSDGTSTGGTMVTDSNGRWVQVLPVGTAWTVSANGTVTAGVIETGGAQDHVRVAVRMRRVWLPLVGQ